MALAEKLHHSAFRTHLPKKEEVEQDQALRGQTKASAREGEVHEKDVASRSQSTPHPGERPGLPPEPGLQRSDRTVRRSSGDNLPTLALPVLAGSAGEVVDSSSLRFLTASALKTRREEEEERKKKEEEKMEQRLAVHVEAALALERARLLSEQASKRRKRKKRRKRRTPRTSSLPSLRRPRRRQRQLHVPGWFYWWYAGRAVLFAVVGRPEMLGIKAVLDQKNSYALFLDSGMCKAGIAGTVHLAMCLFPGLQAHDARRHGRYEPEGILRGEVLDVPVVWTFRFSGAAVEKTLALPQLQLVENLPFVVSDCRKLRILRGCSSLRSLSSCRDAEAYPHGPCDHRDSPFAFRHGGQCPYYAGRAGSRLSASLSWRRDFPMVQTDADH